MDKKLIAKASVAIEASAEKVWEALTNPETIKQYMFGTNVVTDWREGSPIVWKGEWKGTTYEDKGTILQFQPRRLVQYSHYSPLSGLPDTPENHHTVTVELTPAGSTTTVVLTQDNNANEQERTHSAKNWEAMLGALKGLVEQ